MIKEAFLGAVISNVTSLVKGNLKNNKTQKDIETAAHKAFSEYSNHLLPLCSDETFSRRLFDLAKGQTVDAKKLVELGVDVSKEKQLGLSRLEIIEILKEYSKKLLNIIEKITPNTGDIANSFNNFYNELAGLQRSERLSDPHPGRITPIIPGTLPHNIPMSSTPKTFLGRESVLKNLRQRLDQNNQVAITAVWGMGGIGKTELAIQHARSTLKTYPGGIIWINARSEDVGLQIVSFCEIWFKMNFPDEQKLADRVKRCWTDWTSGGDVLVVFDDVHDYTRIEPFLPPQPSRFKMLVTSRLNLAGADTLSLDVLDEDFALELLSEWIGLERIEKEIKTAKELCSRLGYLPLALQLVGNYLDGRNIPLSEMIRRLAEKGLEHRSLDVHETDNARALKIKRGVKAAFELTWNDLSDNDRRLGCLLSLFAQAPIPWKMIKKAVPSEEIEDNETALAELLNWHLLQGEDPYRLHQLTREFFKEKFSISNDADQLKQRYASAMAEVASEIPQSITMDQVEMFLPYIPHISEVAAHLHTFLDDNVLSWPLRGLGRFYQGQGFSAQAEAWVEKSLEVCENRLGGEHQDVAACLNDMGELYREKGRYEEAERHFLRALKIMETEFGLEHPNLVFILNNLARLYYARDRYGKTESLYRRALKIMETEFGPEHPEMAFILNNIAELYRGQGRYKEAEPLLKRALKINEKLHGKDGHPNAATIFNNMAVLYDAQGHYEQAEPLYLKALKINKKFLRPEHPKIVQSLNNLAALYDAQGRHEEAEPLYKRALRISEKVLGPDHPNTKTMKENLAVLYENMNK